MYAFRSLGHISQNMLRDSTSSLLTNRAERVLNIVLERFRAYSALEPELAQVLTDSVVVSASLP